jgi:hypothetical protein
MREAILLRLQVVDELVLAREASARDITRAAVDMMEAGRCRMSASHMASQIAFESVMFEAAVVWTVTAFIDGVKVDV